MPRRATLLIPLLAGLAALFAVPAPAQVGSELVIEGLVRPVRLVAPRGDIRLFVVERGGTILVYSQAGAFRDTFLDIRHLTTEGGERGLLGLAFPPDHATTGRCYVSYTDLDGDSRVARYTVSADPDRLDPQSAAIVFGQSQPFANHNGGHVEFGPDGMLYLGLGDGGGSGDPGDRAQDDQTLLGKMLRLDVSGDGAAAIPPDNPFAGTAGRDEIWALGLRNPWCFAFDRGTGDLYIADVGQNVLEEVDVQPAASGGGENYGWRLMEGSECYEPPTGCEEPGLVLPVHEYAHGGDPFRCSITGGYVYRGANVPALRGRYLFADFCSGQVWSLTWDGAGGTTDVTEWTPGIAPDGGFGSIAGFGQDGAGELYVLGYETGEVHRLISTVTPVPGPQGLRLRQNVPNPFNPTTRIVYAADPDGGPVVLRVYDAAGRLVRTLVDGPANAGPDSVIWDGTDRHGRPAAAGVYHCRLEQGARVQTRKMVMLQ